MLLKPWNRTDLGLAPGMGPSALDEFRDRVDRLFGRMESLFGDVGTRSLAEVFPGLNVWEDENAIHAEAEVPGIAAKDIEIYVRGAELTIRGRRSATEVPEGATWHRQERLWGEFVRTVTLPSEVEADKVEAKFNNGMLTLTMPKAEHARPMKIEIREAESKALK